VFHQVSTWEIQIKYDLGKLPLPQPPSAFLREALTDSGIGYADIEDDGIYMLGKLPDWHRDPFDRLSARPPSTRASRRTTSRSRRKATPRVEGPTT